MIDPGGFAIFMTIIILFGGGLGIIFSPAGVFFITLYLLHRLVN